MSMVERVYEFLLRTMKEGDEDGLYITVKAPDKSYSIDAQKIYVEETQVAWDDSGPREVTIEAEDVVEIETGEIQ